MPRLPQLILNMADQLMRLPGIGPKTAEKLAYWLARQNKTELETLAKAVLNMANGVTKCAQCGDLAEQSPCHICNDLNRDQTVLCIVADSAELHTIERLGEYHGLYHVLGGTIKPIEGVEPAHLRIKELEQRLKNGIKEIILALNPDLEGETTVLYLSRLLKQYPVKITKLARGLPTGSEIEYADDGTLSDALKNRREV